MNTKAKAGWFVLIRDVETHELLDTFGPYKSQKFATREGEAFVIKGKTYVSVVGRRY